MEGMDLVLEELNPLLVPWCGGGRACGHPCPGWCSGQAGAVVKHQDPSPSAVPCPGWWLGVGKVQFSSRGRVCLSSALLRHSLSCGCSLEAHKEDLS